MLDFFYTFPFIVLQIFNLIVDSVVLFLLCSHVGEVGRKL